MEFNPNNPIVKLCLQGMAAEEKGNTDEASTMFLRAWNEATQDFEKFIASHYVAKHQPGAAEKLKWLETQLQLALRINDDTVSSALPALYLNMVQCHEALGNAEAATTNRELAKTTAANPTDKGPFYHGTRADLQIGDMLTPGRESNYKSELTMNHIYFTAMPNGAGLAAALAKGEGRERIYIVEPTGSFENDPNVTDKKFPGNPTRSYRTTMPLKIVGELSDWVKQKPEDIQKWRERLANSDGEIIN